MSAGAAGSARARPRPIATLADRLTRRDPATAAIGLPVLLLAVLGWSRRWAADDAYIDFRVVDNLLHGLGPVFNAGERVEAYTSPLWVAILAAVHGLLDFNLPWTAVAIGLALTVAGLACGAVGALLLWRSESARSGGPGRSVALPVGAIVFASISPVWDFATSGLETGLVFAWLGAAFLALARMATAAGDPPPWWARPVPAALLIGIGPLIRPDLGVFSLGFLVVLALLAPAGKRLARTRLVGWALLLPVAYQLFRMGYFAALVPNTAIAKEAGKADWSRGWAYLKDFVGPYALYVPLAAAAVLAGVEWRRRRWQRGTLAVAAAPVICGLVHSLYVVRVGGDFMHGRLFLPGLFGVLLPVLVVAPARWSRVAVGLASAAFAWSLVAGLELRERYPGYPVALRRFVDERAFYVASSHNGHPVTVADYRLTGQIRAGLVLRRRVGERAVVELNPHVRPLGRDPLYPNPPPNRSLRNRVVGAFFAVGLVSYSAGHRVTIVDRHGLADAIAARLDFRPEMGPNGRVWPVRYRAGHEKGLPLAWVVARYADLGSRTGRRLSRLRSVAEARRALRCSHLREILKAVDGPLTFDRFVSNIGVAWRLRSFRLPPEPQRAERQLCG